MSQYVFTKCRRRFILLFGLVLVLYLTPQPPKLSGAAQDAAAGITIEISLSRTQLGAESFNDSILIRLKPGLPMARGEGDIANSKVVLNSKIELRKQVLGRDHVHNTDTNIPMGTQELQIYIQMKGETAPLVKDALSAKIKPRATATIDVPDKISLVSPSARSTRAVGDLEVRWRAAGPIPSFRLIVRESLGGASYGTPIIDRSGITGDHFLVPASTFEAGKTYMFQIIGPFRNISALHGTYSPHSFVSIGTGTVFWVDFR